MMEETGMSKLFAKNIKLYEWEGCEECNHSWYAGRVGIYEIIALNSNIRDMIRKWVTTDTIIKEARRTDLITMKEDGILKALRWFTTIEEILRVV
jgi:type IV pilus assembly protein PilB